MTDEEKLAEEYANKEWTPFRFHDTECYVYNDDIREDVKQAFLAGLKAGTEKARKEIEEDLLKCYSGYPEKEE